MYSTNASIVLVALQLLAVAAVPEKRGGTINVKLCTETNLASCTQVKFPTDYTCQAFDPSLQKNVKSVEVDVPGTSDDDCSFFLTTDCTGDSYEQVEDKNLTDGNGKFAGMVAAMCGPS